MNEYGPPSVIDLLLNDPSGKYPENSGETVRQIMNYEPESEWLLRNAYLFCCADPSRTYLDLGASHPTHNSLTSFVRNLNWIGLAIDGNPDYEKDWIDAGWDHHFFPAILSSQPQARFAIHDNSFTSRLSDSPETDHPEKWGINRIVEQDTVPLNQILATRGLDKIDLLCCDLEGSELDVLRTLDWERHAPSWVIVEYVTAGKGIDHEIANYLLSLGYELAQMFPSNLIFRRK